MQSKRFKVEQRQKLWFLSKGLIALGLLIWLWKSGLLDLKDLLIIPWGLGNVLRLAAAVSSILVVLVVLAVRLKLLLQGNGIPMPLTQAIQITCYGSFCGAFLPGLVGGDLVRAGYICALPRVPRIRATTCVFFDRLMGVYALILLGALGLAFGMFRSMPLRHLAPTVYLLLAGATVGGGVGLLAIRRPRLRAILARLLPRAVSSRIIEMLTAMQVSARNLGLLVLLSLASHALTVFGFFAVGGLFGDHLSLSEHCAVDPLAMLMNIVPLTPGGIGVTEGAFAYLYQALSSENGALIGLIGRSTQYLAFLLGAGFFWFGTIRLGIRKSAAGMNRSKSVCIELRADFARSQMGTPPAIGISVPSRDRLARGTPAGTDDDVIQADAEQKSQDEAQAPLGVND